jgi:hypothetical protein
MSIREVFPGPSDTAFIELQMYSSLQQSVGGQPLLTYGPAGALVNTFTFPNSAGSGANQRSILVGEPSAAGSPDFTDADGLGISAAGGAVCFDSNSFPPIDCVSWGGFSGNLPSPAGDPASSAGITAGKSLTRSIAPGCATLLEAADDSDDSASDFAETDPTPRNNSVTATEAPCPNTVITKQPKARTKDRTPKFEFTSVPANPAATFECKLDDGAFEGCDSPFKLGRQARGKHRFQVKAGLNGGEDPSPASYRWKIVKR